MEHLNRRITSKVDDSFDVIDPSKKSFYHIERTYRVAKEVKIDFRNPYVIGGFRLPESLESQAAKVLPFKFLGRIAYAENVEENVLTGKSLLTLPSNTSAYLSVKRILEKAGYAKAVNL